MSKYAHVDNTGKLLGWYDDAIHTTIPKPNVKVADEQWQTAIDTAANCYEGGEFIVKDYRTPEEIAKADLSLAKQTGEVYTLNGVEYQVPFMKDDADGLMQVNAAFGLGVTDTVIHFTNGVKMPIATADFQAFALWFVTKRNAFFTV